MICRTCRSPIADHLLMCERCVREQSEKALAIAQLYPLKESKARARPLSFRVLEGRYHVLMFPTSHQRAFCGLPLAGAQKPKWPDGLTFSEIEHDGHVCPRCREEVARLLQQALAAA